MRHLAAGLLLLVSSGLALAGDEPLDFAKAQKIWESTKDRKDYQAYGEEFVRFNNHFKLDEKDGCYGLGSGPVELMLVITHDGKSRYAKIERVLTDVDNSKASCFKKSYGGVPTKIPPFLPFVMQMKMG